MPRLRVAPSQINVTVSDLQGNVAKILESADAGRAQGVDLVVFPELVIPGYPPEDVLLKPHFIEGNLAAPKEVATPAQDILMMVGLVDRSGYKRAPTHEG